MSALPGSRPVAGGALLRRIRADGHVRREVTAVRLLVVTGFVVGLAIRLWILKTPALGYLDSDEAVPGLMARHFLHGHLSTFYWGQNYGGTFEVVLVALAFLIGGSSSVMLSLVPIALSGVAAILVWRIGCRTIGMPAAAAAASARMGMAGLLRLALDTRVRVLRRPGRLFAGDPAAGAPPSRSAQPGRRCSSGGGGRDRLVVESPDRARRHPALVWLVVRRSAVLRYAPLTAAAVVVTSSPWVVANVRSSWASLRINPTSGHPHTYGFRLEGFFSDTLPTTLGLRTPFTLQWLPTRPLGLVALVGLLAAIAIVLTRRRRSLELLAAVIVPFPFLYALSGYTSYRIEPRYLGMLAPLLALVVAATLTNLRAASIVLIAACALSLTALIALRDAGAMAPGARDVRPPTTVTPLIHLLDQRGITRARADYWVAFRVTFLTNERIIVAPTTGNRYPAYRELVERSDRVATIYVSGSATERLQRTELLTRGYTRIRAGPYIVYLP